MSKTNGFENSLMQHIFTNQAITGIGDAGGLLPSAGEGSLYIALFTADPGEAGAFTNEATYGGYARVAVARNATQWTIAANQASNANAVTFPEATGGPEVITHFAICDASTAGTMLYSNILSGGSETANTGVTLEFAAGTLTVTED